MKRMKAAFLDYATLGPGVDTTPLDDLVDVDYYDYSPPDEIPDRLRAIEVGIVNKAGISAETIAANRSLKLIVLAATGSDNVDLVAAKAHGVAVANIRNYCTPAVVQHVFALILALTRQISGYQAVISSGACLPGIAAASPGYSIFLPIPHGASRAGRMSNFTR